MLDAVIYTPADDQYIIAVGTWIEQHKEALALIYQEYDLPKDKTIIKQAHHWYIGQTWVYWPNLDVVKIQYSFLCANTAEFSISIF